MLQLLRKPLASIDFADIELNELFKVLVRELKELPDKTLRMAMEDALHEFSRDLDYRKLMDSEVFKWRRKVVDIDQFMFDPYYLGLERADIYPAVSEACIALDSDNYVEAVLKGCIGSGKSTLANIMLCRGVYKISCMRNPQHTFGIQTKSSIVFTIQSVRFNTAKKAVFGELGQYIHASPYFRDIYPYDKKIQSQMVFPQHNVSILPVSSSNTGAISMNVVGGVLDEMNFMQKIGKSKSSEAELDGGFDQAKRLYETLSRRRRSRFIKRGHLPGMLFLVSSSRFPDDFTEKKAAEAASEGGTDPKIYVYSHAQWTAKPRSHFLEEEFRVLIGDQHSRSKILTDGEATPPGARVINVPMDFKADFERDVDGCIRDFAGITTLATKPFIKKRNAIFNCMQAAENAGYKNIFKAEEFNLDLGIPRPIKELIRLDVRQSRACHVDLGLTKDACGLSIGHVAGVKTVSLRSDDTGDSTGTGFEVLPIIAIDCAMRIVAPPNGEIDFSSVRNILFKLRDEFGLPIKWVTFDGFNSVDSRQILAKKGFATDYLSVSKIEPYRTLRDAMYDERVLIPKLSFLAQELAELEHVVHNNKEKVDHRPGGKNDIADSLCGVVSFLSTRRSAWANLTFNPKPDTMVLFGDKNTASRIANRDYEDNYSFMHQPTGLVRRSINRKAVSRK